MLQPYYARLMHLGAIAERDLVLAYCNHDCMILCISWLLLVCYVPSLVIRLYEKAVHVTWLNTVQVDRELRLQKLKSS